MSFEFDLPASWRDTPAPPTPAPPEVDHHRIEGLVNDFISAKQDALFTAPDAFYRRIGGDAVDGAPAIFQRLDDRANRRSTGPETIMSAPYSVRASTCTSPTPPTSSTAM
jgi:hypothetical protein